MISHRSLPEAAEFILARYRKFAPLTPQDEALFRAMEGPIEHARRGRELYTEGAPLTPKFLLSGWACRFRLLGDGRRIILAFIVPGDGIGHCRRPHPLALTSVTALTDCVLVNAGATFGPGPQLRPYPNLRAALNIAQSLDEFWLLDQITRLGRQTAFERMGHLLLELHWRLAQVGLTEGPRFQMPLTQELIADATGLSVVHVNRTVQQLRRENLIEWRHQTVTLLEPTLLAEIAEFRAPRPSEWDSQV